MPAYYTFICSSHPISISWGLTHLVPSSEPTTLDAFSLYHRSPTGWRDRATGLDWRAKTISPTPSHSNLSGRQLLCGYQLRNKTKLHNSCPVSDMLVTKSSSAKRSCRKHQLQICLGCPNKTQCTGSRNNRYLFSHDSQGWKSKTKVQAGASSLLSLQMVPSHCVLTQPFLCTCMESELVSPPLRIRTWILSD